MIGLREDQQIKATLVSRIDRLFFVARELAPAGARSGPKNGTATQSSGSKLPRHKSLVVCSSS